MLVVGGRELSGRRRCEGNSGGGGFGGGGSFGRASCTTWDKSAAGTRALLGQVPEPVLARRKFRPSPSTVSQWVGDGLSIGEAEDVDQAGRAALLLASTLASASTTS